jgi:thiamine pyrophosphokinase
LGATGKREDHTLGNISLLIEYMKKGLDVRMFTDHGVFIPCQGKTCWEVPTGTQVSIFSFGVKDLNGTGLQYPLSDFTNWWQGTLNEATSSVITLEGKGHYLLFFKY